MDAKQGNSVKPTPGPWEAIGNAVRLIAAAPDLLAALRLAEDAENDPDDDAKQYDATAARRAAIAKAEGR